MFNNQYTISNEISFSGIGLHSGKLVKIRLMPAKENNGINFIFKKKKIKASWSNSEISQLCTKIKFNEIYLSTIEHLMSALSGLNITNLKIETSSNEIPILDGSAKEFIDMILKTGIQKQNAYKKILKIKRKVKFKTNDKFIEIEPTLKKKLIIDYTIDYQDEFIKKQRLVYEHTFENFKKIYKARTFCLHKDLEKIFSMGLAKGGSLENAIVVSGNKILNQGGLRYKDEFVKHKILDCVGDLYLAENQIWGKVTTYGGGHELNLMILKKIFKDKKNYELIDCSFKEPNNAQIFKKSKFII